MSSEIFDNDLRDKDYYNMIAEFIRKKGSRKFLNKDFTFNDVAGYCVAKTEVLDVGDIQRINSIVFDALNCLIESGNIKDNEKSYSIKKKLKDDQYFVFDGKETKLCKQNQDSENELEEIAL